MYSNIIKLIDTQESAEIVNEAIDILCDNVYRTDIINLPQDEAVEIMKDQLNFVKINKIEWLSKLKEEIKKMRLLRLEIAVRLDLKTRSEIFFWVKKNVGEDVAVRFEVSPDFLSGAKIMFEGRYYEKRI